MISCPIDTVPVKATLRTSGCSTIAMPTTEPGPVTALITPSGRPASWMQRRYSSAAVGVSEAGLATSVQPVARAGPTFHATSDTG